MALGNSDGVQVGDVVLAVGNPLGVGQTVTMGIISAKGRSTQRRRSGSYEDFLQTDAPINHGNSGGALVNTKGELVGINSQILSESGGNIGIGFAIPSNMAKNVMDELRTSGKVTRAQLGVSVQGVTSDLAESLGLKDVGGALIGSVTPGSAADRAGLKRGRRHQVVQRPAGAATPTRCATAWRKRNPGSTADVTIIRDGEREDDQREARRSGGRQGRGGRLRAGQRRPDGARRLGRAADAGTGLALPAAERHARASSSRTSIRTGARPTPASRRATSSKR